MTFVNPTPEAMGGSTRQAIDAMARVIYNMPRGPVAAPVHVTTAQTGITATGGTDLTGFTLSWAAEANRRYRICASVRLTTSASLTIIGVNITDAANTIIESADYSTATTNQDFDFNPEAFVDVLADAQLTYKCRYVASGGTTTSTVVSSTQPGLFWVEDVGPVTPQ